MHDQNQRAVSRPRINRHHRATEDNTEVDSDQRLHGQTAANIAPYQGSHRRDHVRSRVDLRSSATN